MTTIMEALRVAVAFILVQTLLMCLHLHTQLMHHVDDQRRMRAWRSALLSLLPPIRRPSRRHRQHRHLTKARGEARETTDTLEEKRCRIENIYKQEGLNGGQRAEVIHLMETTYSLQHLHINEMPAPSVEDLWMKWPYLFTQRGIYAHFELLTDIKALQVLELSMEEYGQAVVEYFRTKSNHRDVQALVSQGLDRDLTLLVVKLVMAHFGESPDGLMIHINKDDCRLCPRKMLTFQKYAKYRTICPEIKPLPLPRSLGNCCAATASNG
ncbi:hypothetical protein PAMA_005551 [Pampus argenteus]